MLITRKKNVLRPIYILLSLLTLLLTACSVFGGGNTPPLKQATKAPASKQIYTIPEVGLPHMDFDTLDPALAQDPASTSAIQMLYTGLVQLDDKLHVQGQLAQNWQLAPDGLTWTFHLKPNLKFSDGNALTSADVAYSIDRALQPATQSPVAAIYLQLIKDSDLLLSNHTSTLINDSIQTPNRNTVVIITKKKAAYFPAMLTNVCSYVVEQSMIKKYGSKFTDHLNTGGGEGPFKVAQYTHQVSLKLLPDTYYSPRPQLQHVTFVFYRTADAAYQDYTNNIVDMASVPTANLAADKSHKDFFQVPQLWTNYYAMNYLTKPFDNINIRKAFALAINKTQIAHDIWKDTVIPTNNIVPRGMDAYNPKLTGPDGTKNLSGDQIKARAFLQQGLKDEGYTSLASMPQINLSYVTGVSNFDQEVTRLIQMWHQVLNVTVTADPISDYNTLLDKVTAATNNPNGLQMWGLAWVAEYPDAHDWLTLQFGKGATNNNMNYGQNSSATTLQQQTIQQQLEDADANQTAATRLTSYQSAEQQIVNDVGWIPMDQVIAPFLRDPTIVGIVNNGMNLIPPNDWAKIYRIQ